MHKEIYYTWDSARKRLDDLRDCGLQYTVVIEVDDDLDLYSFVIIWKK